MTRARKATSKTPGKSRTAKRAKADLVAQVEESNGAWNLRLYVAGRSPKSVTALANLQRLCEQHLPGKYQIEVIDLLKDPQRAQVDQILAIPTLVRKIPEPIKRVIGDLSDSERTMLGLDLRQILG